MLSNSQIKKINNFLTQSISVISAIIVIMHFSFLSGQTMDANALLKKAEGLQGQKEKSIKANISIKLTEGGNVLNEVRYMVFYKGHNKTLVKQTYPDKVKGNAILMLDNNMWFHARGNARSIRITPQQRLIGGASNADIAKMGFSYDYQAVFSGIDTLGGNPCYMLDLNANNTHLPYQKARIWIEKKSTKLKKAELFAVSGKKLKTILYGPYRKFRGGIFRPESMTIRDHLFGKEKKTVIRYLSLQPDTVPNKYFNINYLVHIK